MEKLLFILGLSVVLVSSSFTPAFAESESFSENTKEELIQLEQETGAVEFFDISELPEGIPILEFDSVEELQKTIEYARSIEKNENFDKVFTPISKDSGFSIMASTGTARIQWYTAENWDYIYKIYLPSTMWIDLTYTYTGSGSTKKFSKITKVTSNSTSFPSTWIQETKSTSFYDSNRGVTVKIAGYHLLGVSIKGFNVGAKFPETYTKKYHF
ncbi:hypothetical protein J27TS8_23910 [Robertmurraya siralis]|uniref:Uncharacterized protein n=1 Tax=Robertmurraya siralis TaxID=77777 RepID=A0A919WI09_9BACI|nr:hypothetical protein [Robertmurraya siralis]GIN62398.1 hypothetical protein J27TS8_23910 [Robertmurraya siralis]